MQRRKHMPAQAVLMPRSAAETTFLQVAVLDGKNQKVSTGKIGEVCIRGPNVTAGYLNNPSANKEAFAGKSHIQLCKQLGSICMLLLAGLPPVCAPCFACLVMVRKGHAHVDICKPKVLLLNGHSVI